MEETRRTHGEGTEVETEIETETRKPLTHKEQLKKIGLEAAVYAAVFLFTLVAFLTVKPYTKNNAVDILLRVVMGVLLCGSIALIAYLGATKRLNLTRLIAILLFMGFVLRLGYMLYTPANVRQQDTYTSRMYGHEAYAWTLFSTGKMPSHNDYQFYHPPLNALLQAGFMKFTSLFGEWFGEGYMAEFGLAKPDYIDHTRYFLYSSCQILCVMYSVITSVVCVKIISLFPLSDKAKAIAAAFVIFYPRHMQFAGMLNNDALSYMFGMLALYFCLKWWKGNKNFTWILLCALAVGLGMMSKLSSATVCLPIAGVFIYEFVETVFKRKNALPWWKIVTQYALFLCICAPIGLWFQVYAKVRFDQPFGHVFDNLNTRLYTGDYSLFERFVFPLDMQEFFGSFYCKPFDGNYYLFHYALRSSIFGEFYYSRGSVFGAVAMVAAYLGAILLFIALVWCVALYFKNRKKKQSFLNEKPVPFEDFLFVFLLMQSQVVSEIYFYLDMPYACTMDFRYIMPMISAMALTVAFTHKTLVAEGGKFSLALNRMLVIVCLLFLVFSAAFYCVCAG